MIIFVANLPRKFRSKDLACVFSEFGTIQNAYIVYDKKTHNSKGYGFVVMENNQEAEKAIQELNEREFDSHIIYVAPAKASLQGEDKKETSEATVTSESTGETGTEEAPEVSETTGATGTI